MTADLGLIAISRQNAYNGICIEGVPKLVYIFWTCKSVIYWYVYGQGPAWPGKIMISLSCCLWFSVPSGNISFTQSKKLVKFNMVKVSHIA